MSALTIVTYHSLDSSGSPISVEPAMFRRHMQWFANHQFRSFTLSDGLAHLRVGRLPSRALALTFDDGFLNTASVGWPVLGALGFTATVFLVSDYVGRHNEFPTQPGAVPRLPLMDWAAARDLHAAGWEIGGHTRTHPDLTRVVPGQLRAELEDSRTSIEQQLGSPISVFAYPYGKHGARERGTVGNTYTTAVSTRLGLVRRASDRFALERVDAYYLTRPDLVRLVGAPLLPAYLRLRQAIRDLRHRT